ncbi:Glutaminase 2 [Clostridium liquoris]|jgi:glutaminase|uniref:Glutaminase n=1 Tax=Clostridium liquoris TaxID=1289519 RepID=A0A2T0B3B4_9CLOT|nr:glutaminase A [Clostridium liquoris]PRR78362.1 Glutaminase 2 [Clostridium liquoris]
MEKLLDNIIQTNRKYVEEGEVASYIPELKKGNKNDLGVYVTTLNGEEFSAGDYETRFTIQSISKVISLIIAIMDNGEDYVFSKVGVEHTADAFNSITNLETKNLHRPSNPMINAGAIAIVSLIKGREPDEVFERILNFTRKITGNDNININREAYISEKATGDRNRSLAYFMKSTGVITNDVEKVLDVYFKQCSMEVTCKDISRIGAFLANDGVIPLTGEKVIPRETARIVKAIMTTCGMYDASGEFAVNIGMPAKSGVGGGIMAVAPEKMGIGVVGPSLDKKGNSIAGIKVLADLSKELELSIF